MAERQEQEFNVLHRSADGELLHAECIIGASYYFSDGFSLVLPKLDMRNGDTITLIPKPVRPPLLVPLPDELQGTSVEVQPTTVPRPPIIGDIEEASVEVEISAPPMPETPLVGDDDGIPF